MNADGSRVTRILGNTIDARVAHLGWSPDGTRIAWVGEFSGEGNVGSKLYVVNADGSGLRAITDKDVEGGSVSWRNIRSVS